MKPIAYILKAGPFYGYTQSIIYADEAGVERVAYSGKPRVTQGERVLDEGTPDQTFEQYKAERGEGFRIVSEAELDALMSAHEAALITIPQHGQISEERFFEMLEVLPPCRWKHYGKVEAFHVSERLSGNLVSWFCRSKTRDGVHCYEWTDSASVSDASLTEQLKGL